MSKPRVLVWDIETGFNILAKFNLWPEYSNYKNILNEKYIICASWKWLDENKVHSVSILDDPERFKKDPTDDKYVVKKLHEVLGEADALIHHHGDKFDWPYFQSRAIKHKLRPLGKKIKIDTKKIASSNFAFNSNRLDYLGKYLGVGVKVKTDNDLWLDCLKGSKKAVRKMVVYNKQDVKLLEDVYNLLAPYVPAKVNHALFGEVDGCPHCGETKNFQRRGYAYTRVGKYQKYQCNECYGWFQERVSEAVKDKKVKYK